MRKNHAENVLMKSLWLMIQSLVAAIVFGVWAKSWGVFGIVFVGLVIISNIRVLAMILGVLYSLCWGAIGFFIGTFIHQVFSALSAISESSEPEVAIAINAPGVVLGIIFLGIALLLNISVIQSSHDAAEACNDGVDFINSIQNEK